MHIILIIHIITIILIIHIITIMEITPSSKSRQFGASEDHNALCPRALLNTFAFGRMLHQTKSAFVLSLRTIHEWLNVTIIFKDFKLNPFQTLYILDRFQPLLYFVPQEM